MKIQNFMINKTQSMIEVMTRAFRSDKQQPIILPFNFPKIQNSSQKMTNKTKDIVLAKFIAIVSKWN